MFLIASVVTIVNSIDLTVLTIYNYTKVFTPVLPRIAAALPGEAVVRVPADIQAQIRKDARRRTDHRDLGVLLQHQYGLRPVPLRLLRRDR